MTASNQISEPAHNTDPLDVVTHHESYRGVTVEHNMLAQFTMYTVHLDNLGIFISFFTKNWALSPICGIPKIEATR